MKKKFFSANLGARGRLIRGGGGTALVIAGIALWRVSLIASIGLIILGGFMLFEAVRGWCALRACGIKTKF